MSLNAYFAYSIVLGRGVPWQTALGVVFLSGVLFLVLTLTKAREQIVNGIPDCLKHGPQVLLAAIGLIFIAVLMPRRVSCAILLGILAITIVGIPPGLADWPSHLFSLPHRSGTLLKLDLRSATKLGLADLIFVFFFVDLFDNVGTRRL